MMLDMFNDADDLEPDLRFFRKAAPGHALAERAGVRPEAARQRFVNDDYTILPRHILRCEETPGQQWGLHDLEIVGSRDTMVNLKARQVAAFGISAHSFEGHRVRVVILAERKL